MPVLPFFPACDPDVVPPTPTAGLVLSIAGTDRSSYYRTRSLSISETLGSRSTCSFRLYDPAGTLSCPVGSEVIVQIDGETVFSGTIESSESNFPSMDYSQDDMFLSIRCVDWNQLLDRRLVARSFDADGQTFGQIVREIIDEYLADDGVVPGQIQSGGQTDHIVFQYETVNSCLSALADAVGYVYYIDYNKQLHFRDRIDVETPFSLTASSPDYRRITVKRNRSQYRNRQFLRGGLEVSPNKRTEEFPGDNETQTFTTALPIGAEPEVWVQRGVPVSLGGQNDDPPDDENPPLIVVGDGGTGTGWERQTVGIESDDGVSQATFQWYFSMGDNTVTQNSNEVALRTFAYHLLTDEEIAEGFQALPESIISDRVRIIYRPLIRILARSESDSEISSRIAVEGGSGIYEAIEEDERIEDSSFAKTKVEGLISQLGRIPLVASIETDQPGVRAGQLQTLTLSKLGLTGSFLIESFSAVDRGDEKLRYTYKALDGEALGGWQVFFRRLINRGRKFIITEGESVMVFGDTGETVTLTDNLPTPDTSNTLGAYTTDPFTVCLVNANSQVGSSYRARETYADVIMASTPTLFYRCDDTTDFATDSTPITDSSGSGNGGSGSTLSTSSPGAVGQDSTSSSTVPTSCFLFLGEAASFQSRITAPASTLNNQSDLTIGFWVNPVQYSQEMNLLNGGTASDLSNYRLTLDANATPTTGGTDSISLHYYDESASATRTVTWTGLTLRKFQDIINLRDQFTHLALVRDQSANTFELFVGGVPAGLKTTNTTGAQIDISNLSVDALVIGQKFDSALTNFTSSVGYVGRLDEFAIFPSVLTTSVIASHAKDRPTRYHVGSRLQPGAEVRERDGLPEQPSYETL